MSVSTVAQPLSLLENQKRCSLEGLNAHPVEWLLRAITQGVDVVDFKRALKETMLEMEVSIRDEYEVDAVMIQKGFFYEAYLDSAVYLNRVMGFNTAKGLHDQLMTGVPAGGLKTCIETIEGQGGRIAVVEQIEKTRRKMRRELRYVTGNAELNINNLVIEYQP